MKVLLATDGSEQSQRAIRKLGTLFSGAEDTEVRIISVAEQAVYGIEPAGTSAVYYQALEAEANRRATEVIASTESDIRTRYPALAANLSSAIISGSPKAAIVEEAEKWNAELIIVGSHGYGFWKRALLGSVSDAVIRHAPCSVLVVRPDKEKTV